MFPNPLFPNAYDDDERRRQRLEARMDTPSRRSVIVFAGGLLALIVFGVLAFAGLPGSGVVLVPIGLGMMLGAGIELAVGRLGS